MNKSCSFLSVFETLQNIFLHRKLLFLIKDFLLALTFPFFSDIDAFYNPTLKVNIYTIPRSSREVDKNESLISKCCNDEWSNKDFKMIEDLSYCEKWERAILFYTVMKREQFHSA